jgi:outer membrane protein TolC
MSTGFSQVKIGSVKEFMSIADTSSVDISLDKIRFEEARRQKLLSALAILDITANVSYSATNNTRLPVSLFPGDAFGGEPGTFVEVQTGVKYNVPFSQYLELKLINPQGLSNYKIANLNMESLRLSNVLSLRKFHEGLISIYYQCLYAEAACEVLKKNYSISDSIYYLVYEKFSEGIEREASLVNAEISKLRSQDAWMKQEFLKEGNYLSLSLFANLNEDFKFSLTENIYSYSSLQFVNWESYFEVDSLKWLSDLKLARLEYKGNALNMLPTLSFFASNSNQVFGTTLSELSNSSGVRSNFIGLKVIWRLPTSSEFFALSKSKFNLEVQQEEFEAHLINNPVNILYEKSELNRIYSEVGFKEKIMIKFENLLSQQMTAYMEGTVSIIDLLESKNNYFQSRLDWLYTVMIFRKKLNILMLRSND